jgi:hypothetical protein
VAIYWTHHALKALEKRDLSTNEVAEILAMPDWIIPDPKDPALSRAFGRHIGIDQWVRVVFRQLNIDDMLVITVHPDRDAVPPDERNL